MSPISNGEGLPPLITVAPTLKTALDQLQAGATVTSGDLVRLLAAMRAFQEVFGSVPPLYNQTARTLLVPIDVLDVICERLVGRREYVIEARKARVNASRKRRLQKQREAERLWDRRPDLTNNFSETARIIAPTKWDTVRRILKKPVPRK